MIKTKQFFARVSADRTKHVIAMEDIALHIGDGDDRRLVPAWPRRHDEPMSDAEATPGWW